MAGAQVISANDGEEALALLLGEKANILFDLVVMDTHLPKQNGMDVVCQLRGAKFDIPVILVTHPESEKSVDISKLLQLRKVALLEKPFDVSDLIEAVRRLRKS